MWKTLTVHLSPKVQKAKNTASWRCEGSLDVGSLYTCISHDVGLEAIKYHLTTYSTYSPHLQTKPNSGNSILQASSCHPKHVINAVPIGQFMRLRRLCTDVQEFVSQSEALRQRFRARGYSEKHLNQAFNKALNYCPNERRESLNQRIDNNSLVNITTQSEQVNNPIHFITEFSLQYNHIKRLFERNLCILRTDPALDQVLDLGYKTVTRRTRTIGNTLAPSLVQAPITNTNWLNTKGMFKCGASRCLTCAQVTKTKMFKSSMTGRQYTIRWFINCNTSFVIYLLECKVCNIQY
ncbi:hypothetical protein XELAEV_180029711mg, partial [Xenopus laevis]